MPVACRNLILSYLLFLLVVPASTCLAVEGHYAIPTWDDRCTEVTPGFERHYWDYVILSELSQAFYGGAWGGDLCVKTAIPPAGEFLTDLLFVVSEIGGDVVQELTVPMQSSPERHEDCWPQEFVFTDVNYDDIPDILMMISCYDGEADMPVNDNVIYYTYTEQDQVFWDQDPALNMAISTFTDPDRTAQAAMDFIFTGSVTPDIPADPYPLTEVSGDTDTCTFDSDWGQVVLYLDFGTATFHGDYEWKDGYLEGTMTDDILEGEWSQSDGSSGSFVFYANDSGFTGQWNYSGETDWRGDWNGTFIECLGY